MNEVAIAGVDLAKQVPVNALQTFADEAFDAAKHSLVERISRDLESYRERTIGRLEDKVHLRRVERYTRAADQRRLAGQAMQRLAQG